MHLWIISLHAIARLGRSMWLCFLLTERNEVISFRTLITDLPIRWAFFHIPLMHFATIFAILHLFVIFSFLFRWSLDLLRFAYLMDRIGSVIGDILELTISCLSRLAIIDAFLLYEIRS